MKLTLNERFVHNTHIENGNDDWNKCNDSFVNGCSCPRCPTTFWCTWIAISLREKKIVGVCSTICCGHGKWNNVEEFSIPAIINCSTGGTPCNVLTNSCIVSLSYQQVRTFVFWDLFTPLKKSQIERVWYFTLL